jgi:hypothetical protein
LANTFVVSATSRRAALPVDESPPACHRAVSA